MAPHQQKCAMIIMKEKVNFTQQYNVTYGFAESMNGFCTGNKLTIVVVSYVSLL